MRAEDKELEGPELEREQRVEASHREEHEEQELPLDVTETVRDASFEHRSRVMDALQLILAGEKVNVPLFYLPQREQLALEALQAAVTGADSMGEFVFAEDRRGLLEQALAVLQQNLVYGEPSQIAELQSKFDSMSEQVGELRGHLSSLEDSQEERDEFHIAARHGYGPPPAATGETDEKPVDEGLGAFVSTLMDGPEVVHEEKKSSVYDEDDLPVLAPTASHDPSPQRRVVKELPVEEKKGKP
ncbi:MAG: hypothetical protein M4D80_18675 [Myxococcota bacterium]|nr:hypothetical protein [Deltaproteobacteria bacterium]MDQ3337192.1 hypothetical protein [Myxococcota bacterium]